MEVSASHGMADLVSYSNADRDIEQVYLLFDLSISNCDFCYFVQGVIFRVICEVLYVFFW